MLDGQRSFPIEPHLRHVLTPSLLAAACGPWAIAPESLQLLGETENFVYQGVIVGSSEARVPRLTHRTHRSPADLEAELDFVRFLAERGQPVCRPLLAADGREWHGVGDELVACCFEQACGERVMRGEPRLWNERLFEHWGAHAGQLSRLRLRLRAARLQAPPLLLVRR
jgi:amicoumacin kinase